MKVIYKKKTKLLKNPEQSYWILEQIMKHPRIIETQEILKFPSQDLLGPWFPGKFLVKS